ncbi:MAG TPA: hypothetical protein VGP89_15585, partial [Candidatus Angelobacter sp.]|nr:hypothetical protein [Candidatus Angelobacter sp.]
MKTKKCSSELSPRSQPLQSFLNNVVVLHLMQRRSGRKVAFAASRDRRLSFALDQRLSAKICGELASEAHAYVP